MEQNFLAPSSLYVVFVFVFAQLLNYWNSFAVAFLAIKIKSYLHVLYMYLLDYLCIHNKICITYLNLQKMKI